MDVSSVVVAIMLAHKLNNIIIQQMTPDQYLQASERTENKFPNGIHLSAEQAEILHGTLGIVTEAGEIADVLKKHLIYGKVLDKVNLKEELGDITWYVALLIRRLQTSFEKVFDVNIEKLYVRYPEKFTEESALIRDIAKERALLESHEEKLKPDVNVY